MEQWLSGENLWLYCKDYFLVKECIMTPKKLRRLCAVLAIAGMAWFGGCEDEEGDPGQNGGGGGRVSGEKGGG